MPALSGPGDIIPSSGAGPTSGVAFPDLMFALGGGDPMSTSRLSTGAGDACPLVTPVGALSLPTVSRSARSCCLRSFFRSRLALSFSALSEKALPFAFPSFGVSLPESTPGGGVGGLDRLAVDARWGGRGRSAVTGVDPWPFVVDRVDGVALGPGGGSADEAEFGVGETVEGVTVLRYA